MIQNPEPAALCFIGGGRVGSVLAYHFRKCDFPLAGIFEKNKKRHPILKSYFPEVFLQLVPTHEIISNSDIIFISVQDDQIENVVNDLTSLNTSFSEKIFAHTSGVYASDILSRLKDRKAFIASAHPIFTFGSNVPDKTSLEGVYFDVDGDATALGKLKELFRKIGGHTIEVSADQKLAIHLASVFYSNFFTGLAHRGQEILRYAGIPDEQIWKPFLPLIQTTLDNLSAQPPAAALTGPIKRGDIRTVERHLEFIAENLPDALPLYVELSQSILELASLSDEIKLKLFNLLDAYRR